MQLLTAVVTELCVGGLLLACLAFWAYLLWHHAQEHRERKKLVEGLCAPYRILAEKLEQLIAMADESEE